MPLQLLLLSMPLWLTRTSPAATVEQETAALSVTQWCVPGPTHAYPAVVQSYWSLSELWPCAGLRAWCGCSPCPGGATW